MSKLSTEETATPYKSTNDLDTNRPPLGDDSSRCTTSTHVILGQQISFGSTRLLHKMGWGHTNAGPNSTMHHSWAYQDICSIRNAQNLAFRSRAEFWKHYFETNLTGLWCCQVAYHPQGDGMIERFNRSLIQLLRSYVEKEADWEQHLPLVLFAYRTAIHIVQQELYHFCWCLADNQNMRLWW